MPREQTSKEDQISIFGEIAKGCRTDQQKIEFFDSSKEAFFSDSNESVLSFNEKIPKDLDDGFYVYANMKKLNKTELGELRSLTWKEYKKNLKLFLFDFCILNGHTFSKYFHD